MSLEKYLNHWKQKYDNGFYDHNPICKEQVKKTLEFEGKDGIEDMTDDFIEYLNESDTIDRSQEAFLERRTNLKINALQKIIFRLSDFFDHEDGNVGFLLNNRICQQYVTQHLFKNSEKLKEMHPIHRADLLSKYWPCLQGEAICYEFDFLVGIAYSSLMNETHFILPYLRKLNKMGVITMEAHPGYADLGGTSSPWVRAILTLEQYEALKSIKYLNFVENQKYQLYDLFIGDEKPNIRIMIDCKDIYRYYEDNFWEDIIEVLETCQSSHYDWRDLLTGKRYAYTDSEPQKNELINIGQMKEFTSGEPVKIKNLK